jgi:PAS domain S-box-containing protein
MPRRSISPVTLALSYASLSATWIVASDSVAAWFTSRGDTLTLIGELKGLLFVGVTSFALYLWAQRLHTTIGREASVLAQARERAEQSRRMYATLSEVNRHAQRPTSCTELSQAICDTLLDPGGFACAWIGSTTNLCRRLSVIAHAGGAPPSELELGVPDDVDSQRLAEVFSHGTPVMSHFAPSSRGCLTALKAATGAQACVAIPFTPRGHAPMVLAVYSREREFFSPDTLALLTQLTSDLAFGIQTSADREAHTAAEAALRASEERYRLLAENSRDVIWILSPDGLIQYVSPSVERILGFTPSQLATTDFSALVAPASCVRLAQEFSNLQRELARSEPIGNRLLQIEQVRADGTTVWTEISVTAFRKGDGRVVGLLGVSRDITQRHTVEQVLAQEVARCRALLDVSVDAIEVTDLQGNLLEANEIFLRERGFSRAMLPQLRIENWNVEMSPREIREHLAATTGEPRLFQTIHRRADGTHFVVEARSKRVEINGHVVIYTTCRDVTETRDMEQRLLRSQRLESVGLIASGIAHDLNNVLTPILLSTGLLEMRYPSSEDAALLKPIEAAARRGSHIVQQILTFARGADGQRIAVDPKLLLKELTHLIRETFPRNIVHELEFAADVARVRGDPTQLHQVFLNLAVNARDAMPAGGTLSIRVFNRQITSEDLKQMPTAMVGDFVCVTVGDSGTGMTPEVLDHLFEPFFTTKPRGRGTGLGLSTVHGLVRSHGGFVEVDSKLGHGSTFRVYLPVASASAVVDSPAVAPTRRAGNGELILIVDDEPAILSVMSALLTRNGYTPLAAPDGDAALALFEARHDEIAVVITDVIMPKCDGVQLAAQFRELDPDIPLVAMSGMTGPNQDDDNRQKLQDLGVHILLHKPYSETDLINAVQEALQTAEPTRAALPRALAAAAPVAAISATLERAIR